MQKTKTKTEIKPTGQVPAIFLPVPINQDGKNPNEPVSAANAFVALSVALMQEYFMSSDTKYFIFLGMKRNLEKLGYSAESIEEFLEAVDKARAAFTRTNGFMG